MRYCEITVKLKKLNNQYYGLTTCVRREDFYWLVDRSTGLKRVLDEIKNDVADVIDLGDLALVVRMKDVTQWFEDMAQYLTEDMGKI